MSLQRRLVFLLVAFAAFALVAAFGTIYVVRIHVADALATLQRSMDESAWVDGMRLKARGQYVLLRDVVDGRRDADELYRAQRDGFFDELGQLVAVARREAGGTEPKELLELIALLRNEFDRCLLLAERGERDAARDTLRGTVETELLPALDACLRNARYALEDSRNRSVDELVATDTQVLTISLAIGGFGLGLVAVCTVLVRRWIIAPIRRLEEATQEFSKGNLGFRVEPDSEDELGALGRAMDRMAAGLAEAQAELQISEAKYRSLFRNLRDAAIICDAQGCVIECHDGDTDLLGKLGDGGANSRLAELWPNWQDGAVDWPSLLDRVLAGGTLVRMNDLKPRLCNGNVQAAVDLIAYPVEFGHARYVAIVLRDVTKRGQVEEALRQSEQRYRALADELRRLMQRLHGVREDERTRIARELHDELGQALTALNMDLYWLKGRSWHDSDATQARISSMCALLNTTIHAVRRICSDLRPAVLDDFGLTAAIEWQAREFESRAGVRCRLSLPATTPALPNEQVTAIFRIFQESLTNIARHAKASEARVTLRAGSDTLSLVIADNGVGIGAQDAAGPHSVGLAGMRERALRWGGQVQILGRPGKGTTVSLHMPTNRSGAEIET